MNALMSLGILAWIALKCLLLVAAAGLALILLLCALQLGYLAWRHHRDMTPKFRHYRMGVRL